MSAKDQEKFTLLFKSEVSDKGKELDPNNEFDWHSLTVGWAIAKGIKFKDAIKFASFIRYGTNLG